MKFGLMFVNSGPFANPELLAHLAQTAERCGFESMWTVEHVVVPEGYQSKYPYSPTGKMPGGEDVPIPDPLLPLAFVAAMTKTIRLGTGVIILPQRSPLYLAKEAATLDVLSHGRFMLGIGSGWLAEEFRSLGLDFHQRGKRTDEAIEAMRSLWREPVSNYHGKHFDFGPVKSNPKPVQKGGVPIHVGGHSPAAARRAGRYGDGFFPALGDPAQLKEIITLMRSEGQKAGRNPDVIEISCMGSRKLEQLKAVQDVGVSRVIMAPPAFDTEGITKGLEKLHDEVIAKMQ
jgi:probable F420-dependent oxidoreductase